MRDARQVVPQTLSGWPATHGRAKLFELILCDVSVPSLHGIGFHQRLLAVAPNQAAHIVFAIGSTVDAHLRDFLDSTRCPLLRRPFRREELRELLAGQNGLLELIGSAAIGTSLP